MPDWAWYILGGLIAILVAYVALKWAYRALRRRWLMRRHGDAHMVNMIMAGRIDRGMTLAMVADAWGEPADLDETVLKTKTKHEMKYDQKGKNRYGTRVYLEDGLVVGWETK